MTTVKIDLPDHQAAALRAKAAAQGLSREHLHQWVDHRSLSAHPVVHFWKKLKVAEVDEWCSPEVGLTAS